MNSSAHKKFRNQFERFMENPPKKVFCPLKPEKIISQKCFSRSVQFIILLSIYSEKCIYIVYNQGINPNSLQNFYLLLKYWLKNVNTVLCKSGKKQKWSRKRKTRSDFKLNLKFFKFKFMIQNYTHFVSTKLFLSKACVFPTEKVSERLIMNIIW